MKGFNAPVLLLVGNGFLAFLGLLKKKELLGSFIQMASLLNKTSVLSATGKSAVTVMAPNGEYRNDIRASTSEVLQLSNNRHGLTAEMNHRKVFSIL